MAGIRDLPTQSLFPYITVLAPYYVRNPITLGWRLETGEVFKMSAEEDTELRDMVAQTLESKGVLGKIRVR